MKKYVLVYAYYNHDFDDVFLIVKKHRPEWQKGLYNLIGGSIEEGETPEQAAIRELKEETGIDAELRSFLPSEVKFVANPKVLGTIQGDCVVVYCVSLSLGMWEDRDIKPREGETELPEWTTFSKIKNNPLLINNLRVIIPLMQQGLEGWEIEDCYPNQNMFKIKVYAVRPLDCIDLHLEV